MARKSTTAIRELARDAGLFAICLFVTLIAGHLLFLTTVGRPSIVASLGPLWAIMFFAPCIVLGYLARRLPVLQSTALYLVAYVTIERIDYNPFFHNALIPAHPSKGFLVNAAVWFALAAFLGLAGALLKKYMTRKRSQA